MDTTKKEERSEYVSIYVTPTLKKEFELAKDNQTLKESIIRSFLTVEKDWLTSELKEIDEATVKYSAKLIGIKDKFQEAQSSYLEQIEGIYNSGLTTLKKLDTTIESTRKSIEYTAKHAQDMLSMLNKIDTYKIDQLLKTVEKFNSMSDTEIQLLKKLINN